MALDKSKLLSMFKKAQNQAKVAAETVTKAVDERFLRLNIGSTYHLRLLYCPSKVRETPFINLETHRHYDPNTKTVQRVVCPTSKHIDGANGFNTCPICKACSDLWKRGQAGDAVAAQLYKENRRTPENYAVVYVVKDTSADNPQTGKIKILRYGFEINKFLNAECLGIAGKGQPEIDQDEIVGFEAFDLEEGRNLVIKVGKKDVMAGKGGKAISFPEYETSFSRSLSAVPVDIDDLPKIFEDLRFDELLHVSTPDELKQYYKSRILSKMGDDFEEAPVQSVEENVPVKKVKTVTELLEEEEDEEEDVIKPVKKATSSKFFDEEEEEEEEVPAKPAKKSSVSKFFDEDEDEEEVEEEEAPAPKKAAKSSKKKFVLDDFDTDLSDLD